MSVRLLFSSISRGDPPSSPKEAGPTAEPQHPYAKYL